MSSIFLLFLLIITLILWILKVKLKAKFYYCVFLLIIFFILNPDYVTHIAQLFGIGRGTDFIVYLQFMFTVYLYLNIFEMKKQTERYLEKYISRKTLETARNKYPSWFEKAKKN